MRSSIVCSGIVCCMALGLVTGYQSTAAADYKSVTPLVLQENEQIIRDQLIILVDESQTIGTGRLFRHEKALVEFFTGTMPVGGYHAGIKSFAGVHSSEWVQVNLAPFNRTRITDGAASLEPLGSTTPLHRALYNQKTELAGLGGRGAVLIFSDGRVKDHEEVLQACRDLKAVHGGELCIYTVQVGNSEDGRKLLQDMATVNGCGAYYNGASLETSAGMNGIVRDILIGSAPREVTRPVTTQVRPALEPIWSLENVHFENDIDVVHPMYNAQLDEVSIAMKNSPDARLRLHGHTDSNASNAYNQALSERRVNAVAAALAQRGVALSRIETQAHGELSPAVPNTNPQNMHLNRRVELTRIE